MKRRKCRTMVALLFLVLALPAGVRAQVSHVRVRGFALNVIVPQTRAFDIGRRGVVEITGVSVKVGIREQAATTTMDVSLRNPTRSRLEAELIVPVPAGAVVRGFTFQGAGKEPSAVLLPKDEARRTYDEIVARVRDPALLEFIGYNLIRSSVFPVEAGGTQKVRLVYENLLVADGDRVDYVLPRSESLDYKIPWQVSVRIESERPISTVYSPSHRLETKRLDAHTMTARTAPDATTQPGAFRLSCLRQRDGVSASLFAYPDPKVGGGYFLLLAGLPAEPPGAKGAPAIKREVSLVLDRSGSMQGEKLEQVREAALQILAGLEDGEAFNIIVYNEAVDLFSKEPVLKTDAMVAAARAYLKDIKARGGTNIHDALVEVLRQKPVEGMLPIVLFLTDGLPTIGQTSEVAIRDAVIKGNPNKRRIFTLGVGVDVNTPLLQRIASETRATATFVLPKEDVEVKVAGVFKRLAGPVLAEPELEVVAAGDRFAMSRVRDMIPSQLPDLFEGDQLVLLGQYVGEKPLTFKISGNYLGTQRTFEFTFGFDSANTKNSFVPRLWASRKIAVLIDAIRQLGADGGLPTHDEAAANPRIKELVDEIVRLSTEFGILTEYTAFLAREGTDLSRPEAVMREAHSNFAERAIRVRSGLGSVSQSRNIFGQKVQSKLNVRNVYWDKNMNRVITTSVQQVNDRAFYRRGNRWVDSRLVTKERELRPEKVIEFGSKEFRELAYRLAGEGRQGTIALRGDILMVVDSEPVLIKGPAAR